MDLRAVFIDFMLRFCDIFSQNSALALKFALSHSVTTLLAQIFCAHTRVLPQGTCAHRSLFVEGQLVLTNQTVPVFLRVCSLFLDPSNPANTKQSSVSYKTVVYFHISSK